MGDNENQKNQNEEAPKEEDDKEERQPSSRPNSTKPKKNPKKEFFKEELKRIRTDLDKEKEKISPPSVKEHVPYIYNTLDPYFSTGSVEFMMNEVNLEEELPPTPRGYSSRQTALGLCDPWVAHKMEFLEEKKDMKQMTLTPRKEKEKKDKDKQPKEGSTRLPKFPAVTMPPPEDPNKQLFYSDLPALRETLKSQYSASGEKKTEADYKRTKQDFYRMELDKFDEYHPINKDNMRATYFAYLQNTPGSKKAIYECLKSVTKTKS